MTTLMLQVEVDYVNKKVGIDISADRMIEVLTASLESERTVSFQDSVIHD